MEVFKMMNFDLTQKVTGNPTTGEYTVRFDPTLVVTSGDYQKVTQGVYYSEKTNKFMFQFRIVEGDFYNKTFRIWIKGSDNAEETARLESKGLNSLFNTVAEQLQVYGETKARLLGLMATRNIKFYHYYEINEVNGEKRVFERWNWYLPSTAIYTKVSEQDIEEHAQAVEEIIEG